MLKNILILHKNDFRYGQKIKFCRHTLRKLLNLFWNSILCIFINIHTTKISKNLFFFTFHRSFGDVFHLFCAFNYSVVKKLNYSAYLCVEQLYFPLLLSLFPFVGFSILLFVLLIGLFVLNNFFNGFLLNFVTVFFRLQYLLFFQNKIVFHFIWFLFIFWFLLFVFRIRFQCLFCSFIANTLFRFRIFFCNLILIICLFSLNPVRNRFPWNIFLWGFYYSAPNLFFRFLE